MGGIASGKTTVAKELAKKDCAVIDADDIAKRFLADRDVKKRLRNRFGGEIFAPSGKIDRKKLAEKVFKNVKTVKAVNAIIHPKVLKKTEGLIKKYQRRPSVKAIVLDIPLLAEVGWHKKCDKLIFVRCNTKIRLKRAEKGGIFGENELKKRENFQISLDKKVRLAHYIVENKNLTEMKRQIGKLFPALIS